LARGGRGRGRGRREKEIKGRANTAKGQKLWDKDGGILREREGERRDERRSASI
jgi:hypothetical protein